MTLSQQHPPAETALSRFDRAHGCLAGVALGDALGRASEFMTRDQIRERFGWLTDFAVPSPLHPGVGDPLGAITDDTTQTLLIARVLIEGRPLTPEAYDDSRWIVEPWRLYDCCMENDGAAAVIVTTAERARDLKQKPAYVIAAAQGSDYRQAAPAHNAPDYATSNFKTVAKRLWGMAGIEPKDVDVCQSYENFTGGVMMSLVEHGFCSPDEVDDFMTVENFRFDGGKLPLNTSGGNLAECYMHGLELITEAVRQVRGTSTAQVPNVDISMVCSGPMVQPVSDLILRA